MSSVNAASASVPTPAGDLQPPVPGASETGLPPVPTTTPDGTAVGGANGTGTDANGGDATKGGGDVAKGGGDTGFVDQHPHDCCCAGCKPTQIADVAGANGGPVQQSPTQTPVQTPVQQTPPTQTGGGATQTVDQRIAELSQRVDQLTQQVNGLVQQLTAQQVQPAGGAVGGATGATTLGQQPSTSQPLGGADTAALGGGMAGCCGTSGGDPVQQNGGKTDDADKGGDVSQDPTQSKTGDKKKGDDATDVGGASGDVSQDGSTDKGGKKSKGDDDVTAGGKGGAPAPPTKGDETDKGKGKGKDDDVSQTAPGKKKDKKKGAGKGGNDAGKGADVAQNGGKSDKGKKKHKGGSDDANNGAAQIGKKPPVDKPKGGLAGPSTPPPFVPSSDVDGSKDPGQDPNQNPGQSPLQSPIQTPTQTPPSKGVEVRLNNFDSQDPQGRWHRYSASLIADTGDYVEVYGDPHVVTSVNGQLREFSIGYGPGSVSLSDGTNVSWDTYGSANNYRLRNFTVDSPGTAFDQSVSTADGVVERRLPTALTDAQVEEFAAALWAMRGSIDEPLAS